MDCLFWITHFMLIRIKRVSDFNELFISGIRKEINYKKESLSATFLFRKKVRNLQRFSSLTKEELLNRLSDIEWDDFEAKEAKSELPKSVWETVSAFANTSGGWIVLGVKQNGKKFEVSGVDNAEKLEQDFLGTIRSQKFNVIVDVKSKLYHIDGRKVLAFHIASSPQKPIYFNNPSKHVYTFWQW